MVSDHAPDWYAVRVKSNRERVTAEALKGKDFEVLLPVYHEYRSSGHGPRLLALPLFAGYVFCRFDPQNRLPVLTVPGVVSVVGFGKVPEPVDAAEMDRITALTQSQLAVKPHPYLPVGKQVRLEAGPLRGVEGIILAHQGEHKLIVSVSLLQRSVAVNVQREWVMPGAACGNAF